MTDHVLTDSRDGILRIQLNRPEKRNALTAAMYEVLANALEWAEADPGVRVVYITGTEDCFTAGNDLMDFMNPQDSGLQVLRFLNALATASKPLVAAVTGVAIGIGTTLLLHCDLVYASDEASFKTPFVDLGLVPEAASSYLLPQLKGHQQAARLLLLGETLDAAEALACGFVSGVVPAAELEATAWSRAQRLASRAPASVRATKQLMKRARAQAIQQAMAAEIEVFKERLGSPEMFEAIQAFMEKREPDFLKLSTPTG